MSEQTMPAAEAEGVVLDERNSYELAFHVLPTVAEGEVAGVVTAIKTSLTTAGAAVTLEEAPQRIELAYEIVKSLEGKNRTFKSAYFGWIRFSASADAIAVLTEALEENGSLLRYLLLKLTKLEEAHPVYYHELMAKDGRVVETIDVESTDDESDSDDIDLADEPPVDESDDDSSNDDDGEASNEDDDTAETKQ